MCPAQPPQTALNRYYRVLYTTVITRITATAARQPHGIYYAGTPRRRFIATEKVSGGGGGGGFGVGRRRGCGGWSEFAVNRSQSFRRNIA